MRKPCHTATVANHSKPSRKSNRHAPHGNVQRRESEIGNCIPSINLRNGHRRKRPWRSQRPAIPANVQRLEALLGNRNATLNPGNHQRRKLQLETATSRSTWKRRPGSSQAANVTPMEAKSSWKRLKVSAAPRAIATAWDGRSAGARDRHGGDAGNRQRPAWTLAVAATGRVHAWRRHAPARRRSARHRGPWRAPWPSARPRRTSEPGTPTARA